MWQYKAQHPAGAACAEEVRSVRVMMTLQWLKEGEGEHSKALRSQVSVALFRPCLVSKNFAKVFRFPVTSNF